MSASARTLAWFGATVLSVSSFAAVLAQSRVDGTDAAASLAPLTSELRQLRVAVEELARTQTQVQALSVYLSVQQSRILQVATRLDSARRDVETATAGSQDLTRRMGLLNEDLAQTTDPERRRQIEDALEDSKHKLRMLGVQEQQARAREGELSQALHLEESRWTDLISRLEQLTKR